MFLASMVTDTISARVGTCAQCATSSYSYCDQHPFPPPSPARPVRMTLHAWRRAHSPLCLKPLEFARARLQCARFNYLVWLRVERILEKLRVH